MVKRRWRKEGVVLALCGRGGGVKILSILSHPPVRLFLKYKKSWKEMGRMEGKGVAGVYDTLFSIAF